MRPLPRRAFLLGSGALLLAACGDGGSASGDADGTTTTAADGSGGTTAPRSIALGVTFNPSTFLLAGVVQRVGFILSRSDGGVLAVDEAPDEVRFSFSDAQSGATVDAVAALHGADIDRPYYPASVTFPSAGIWGVEADLGDGTTLTRDIQVNDAVAFPQVGDPFPAVPTPTTAEPLDAATICTRDPACPFHEISLADAMAAGRPTAVLVSTPAYCSFAICGPVLELLIEAAPADRDVIHIEAFPNGSGSDPGIASPILTDVLHLDFEPVLYVIGGDGLVTARLDTFFDGAELATALAGA